MKLLNLACGAVRPQGEEWVNVDQLLEVLPGYTPEWNNLKKEKNYVEWNIEEHDGALTFGDSVFDGIVASHCIEHWDIHMAVRVMKECLRILKPGGILVVSVPDASTFRQNASEDTPENAVRLYGEPIHLPDGENTFLGYAGFNRWHKTLLTEDSLWCYFKRAGFKLDSEYTPEQATLYLRHIEPILNRRQFSLIMTGEKP